MFKRTQQQVSAESTNWYQDKYQHVLTQRNVLAIIAIIALLLALFAQLNVWRLAPQKSVEPYLLQIDEKTGITQRVNPVSREEYAANESVDRYFASTYLRARETYNPSVILYNYNVVRLMSTPTIFRTFRRQVDPSVPGSVAEKLGAVGRRDIKIRSLAYITNPGERQRGKKVEAQAQKILQARITTIDSMPNQPDNEQQWIITITFEYAKLAINESEQLINPLGFQVTSYQVQREIN